MPRVKNALVGLVVRRPALVASFAALLAVGIGLAGAAPWVEWRRATPPAPAAAFTLERAFAQDAPAAPTHPIPDFTLRDPAGRQIRLRDQAGKVVLVNFITTQCTTACVQVTRELQGLQKVLGARMGREVLFLSIGLDPKRDTSEALWKFVPLRHRAYHRHVPTGSPGDLTGEPPARAPDLGRLSGDRSHTGVRHIGSVHAHVLNIAERGGMTHTRLRSLQGGPSEPWPPVSRTPSGSRPRPPACTCTIAALRRS
ncbi:MAG: SCO family protein [candidate division NC10 bacterium]|nr:SCO family protein [candidate division NC10 bacterium]